MMDASKSGQYKDSRNLRARGNLHARYANRNWFTWVADQIGTSLRGDVLDIGCGAGWFWSSAAGHVPAGLQLTLADTSEGMVGEAVQRLSGKDPFASVTGRTADAAALPFADGSFDAALAMHMLYHVPAPEQAVGELARVLRPKGLAAITTNGDDNMRELFEIGSEIFGGVARDPAAAAFGAEAAQTLLAQHFDDVTLHVFEDVYAIDDAEAVCIYLTSFPPGINASQEQASEAGRVVAEHLDRRGGILKVKRECVLVCGRK
jgi:SAM-dependent methyltransferase